MPIWDVHGDVCQNGGGNGRFLNAGSFWVLLDIIIIFIHPGYLS